MSGQVMAVAFFCLATGAALGCLFLLFRGDFSAAWVGPVGHRPF